MRSCPLRCQEKLDGEPGLTPDQAVIGGTRFSPAEALPEKSSLTKDLNKIHRVTI